MYENCVSILGASIGSSGTVYGDSSHIYFSMGNATSDVVVNVTAKNSSVSEYNISTNLEGCTARSNNVSTIKTDEYVMLIFDTSDGYEFTEPYSSCVSVTGATLSTTDYSNSSCLTVGIGNATSNVTVTVTARKKAVTEYRISVILTGCSASSIPSTIQVGEWKALDLYANDGYSFTEPYENCVSVTGVSIGASGTINGNSNNIYFSIGNATSDVVVRVTAQEKAVSEYSIYGS